MASRVFNTIRSSVPCRTSVRLSGLEFSKMVGSSCWRSTGEYGLSLLSVNRKAERAEKSLEWNELQRSNKETESPPARVGFQEGRIVQGRCAEGPELISSRQSLEERSSLSQENKGL